MNSAKQDEVTQLAKAIFIKQAAKLDFTRYSLTEVHQMIDASLFAAEEFIEKQEQDALTRDALF